MSPTAIANSNPPVAVGGVAEYVAAARALPKISPEEEARLALAYRDRDDLDAAKRLALANLREVVRIADGYLGYGLPRADLVQEGNLGLLRAIRTKRFDPARGFRFITFAAFWVRAAIHEFILRNWRIVRVATTKAQRKLFFNMRRLNARGPDGKMESPEALAREMEVRPEDVSEMRRRLANTAPVPLEDDGENPGAETFLAADPDQADAEGMAIAAQEQSAGRRALREAVAELPERDREILAARRLAEPPETLQRLAARFRISAERVRQLENRAMEKVAQAARRRLAAA